VTGVQTCALPICSEIYRGLFREQLAGVLSNQLQSPLAKQLEEKLQNPVPSELPPQKQQLEPEAISQDPASELTTLPVNGTITSTPGWRIDPFVGEMRLHRGTDIAAPLGTPVQAVEGGIVVESGPKGGYGNAVVIRTDSGHRTLYGHNESNLVRIGDRVQPGQTIAKLGATGRATGPHVHFEVLE